MKISILDPRVEQSLRAAHDALAANGELLSLEALSGAYAAFRSRFGPDKLRALDGPALLQAMHTHGNKESLVYWLEYKNDEEFPGAKLGSIAGGSAHKFRIFRRQGSDQWLKGSPQDTQPISEAEAIEIARQHRDQLLAGVALLESLPLGADDAAYVALQTNIDREAPDISGLAWAHKYWSLLFSEKLDDYHREDWQRHNLIRLLETPPNQEGLYVCAGRFIRLAAQFGWPVTHLTAVCNERNGKPVRYWRIGTEVGGVGNIWTAMRDGSYVAIGWDILDDLGKLSIPEGQRLRDVLSGEIASLYSGDARTASRKAGEIANFFKAIQENDVVIAADGMRVLGVGRVNGPYRFDATPPEGAPHRRPVEWVSTAEWDMPTREGLRTTVCELGRHSENLIEIERALLAGKKDTAPAPAADNTLHALRLDGIPGRLQKILERKGQVIVYGPPGTGKTYWARQAAFDLAALSAFGRTFAELPAPDRQTVEGTAQTPGLVRICTFHPTYGYEDFIEGFRPKASATGQLVFERSAGIFKQLCQDAQMAEKRKFFLLIDEINRGDIPRIFGELLTLLEMDKRGLEVRLPLSGECFSVPFNVHVVATMNTADRSIALLDTALRRRFGFVELLPDVSVFGLASAGGDIPLGPWLAALNDRLRQFLGRDARNLQIGHAYLLGNSRPVTDFSRFVRVLAEDIVPLIEEYCYEDYGALARILGAGLVDESRQRIRDELFAESRRAELVQSLIEPAPGISTAPEAASGLEEQEEASEAEEPEE